jgi:citrate lyase beta subunit
MLFVSGERPERFPKAMAAGADLVCIDLEDAVHPDRKAEARLAVLAWLQAYTQAPRAAGSPGVALRVNGVRTPEGLRDLHALLEAKLQLDWLLLPKVEDPADVPCARAWLAPRTFGVAALIETPLGVERAAEIARAISASAASADTGRAPGALMLGGADLATELGAQIGWDALFPARGRLVNAARAAGLQTWDVPHLNLDLPDELASETRRVLGLGFDCKTAIHPQQIAAIHAAHQPTPAELDWARLLVEAVPDGQDSGAFLYQGRLVDAPLLRKARRIVSNANAGA